MNMEDASTAPSPPESAISTSSIREDGSEPPKKARRTFLTQNACTRCRQKKSKCDGRRPVCGRCEKNDAHCVFDVAQEGLTRMQNLQQLLERKTEDHDRLLLLFSALQQGSDEHATNLLARMRMGEGYQSLARELGASQQFAPGDRPEISDSQDSRSMQSWPPSPLDQGGWNTSNPCSPPGRAMSLSSETHLSVPGASSSYYSYPGTDRAPQLDGESPRQEQGPYYQGQYTPDGEINTTDEPAAASDPSKSFAVPRRPTRGRGR